MTTSTADKASLGADLINKRTLFLQLSRMKLTHSKPDRDVTPGPEVRDEDDGDDVADLVHGRDDAGDARRDLVALLDGRDDGVQVARR